MTVGEISGYVALAGVVFKFLLDAYNAHAKTRRDDQAAEARRVADREKTQRENEGWLRRKVDEMVAHDLAQAKQHALLKANGYSVNVSVE